MIKLKRAWIRHQSGHVDFFLVDEGEAARLGAWFDREDESVIAIDTFPVLSAERVSVLRASVLRLRKRGIDAVCIACQAQNFEGIGSG